MSQLRYKRTVTHEIEIEKIKFSVTSEYYPESIGFAGEVLEFAWVDIEKIEAFGADFTEFFLQHCKKKWEWLEKEIVRKEASE